MPGDNRDVYQYSGDRAGRGCGLAGAIFSDSMDNCEVLCGLRMYQQIKQWDWQAILHYPGDYNTFWSKDKRAEKGRRDKWLSVIKKQDLTEDKIRHAVVCIDHFISGKVTRLQLTMKLHIIVGDVLKSELPFFDVCIANSCRTRSPHLSCSSCCCCCCIVTSITSERRRSGHSVQSIAPHDEQN